jgi:photosystem II stability/assembly factor-like uncharacterized protein
MKIFILHIVFCFLFSVFCFSQVPYYYYPVPSGTSNNLYDIKRTGDNLNLGGYYIVGANGTILRIANADSNWYQINSNTSGVLNAMVANYNTGTGTDYILGNNGVLLKSTNSGLNWFLKYSGIMNNLYAGAVAGTHPTFSNARFIAVGSNGLIIKKMYFQGSDSNLTIIQSGTTNNLKAIFISEPYGWIAGANGTILKSNDTGNTWIPLNSGVNNNLNSVWFIISDTGFFVGDGGTILRTTNGGLNIVLQVSNSSQNLNSIIPASITDSVNLWITGNSAVLFSTNSGTSWVLDSGVPSFNLYSCLLLHSNYYSAEIPYFVGENGSIFKRIKDSLYHPNYFAQLRPNNINSYFIKTGIFDQNSSSSTNRAGFEWPKNSNKYAIYSAGFTIAAKVNGQIRMVAASYSGEYSPGYCVSGNYYTNDYFKIYKVSKSENAQTSWDWAHWGEMVPYGAPFIDVNNNGIYEPAIDTPGVKNAKETIFLCMTDANPASHTLWEGFGGGTLPLGAEVHMTAWAYDSPGLQEVQFISYDIINKSTNTWNEVKMGIVSDPDLGDANDDYVGCDTSLKLGYCYNADNNDEVYGTNPPAVGFLLLTSPLNRSITPNIRVGFTSFISYQSSSDVFPPCELEPSGDSHAAYLMLSGFKKDSTCWLDPTQNPAKKTRFCYPGDPETNIGWTENKGSMWNCGHDSTGTVHVPDIPHDRRMAMGSGANNFNIIPGESQKFVIAQLIARDSGNLKSVTKLKQLCAYVRSFYDTNFTINVNQISANIPQRFELKQNYPNPFNPSTIIRYQIKDSRFVTLKVYDILGREIETLVNEFQKAGTYETQFPDNQYTINQMASGVYFYKLIAGDFVAVKKMVLMK